MHKFYYNGHKQSFFKIKSQKLPAMVEPWENLQRFLWCWSSIYCCYSSFVNVFHSHFHFDVIPQPSVDYHRQVFRSILYFQPYPWQSDSRHFRFSNISLSSYRERYDFEWALFYPMAFFTLRSFPTFLAHPAFWHNLLLLWFY